MQKLVADAAPLIEPKLQALRAEAAHDSRRCRSERQPPAARLPAHARGHGRAAPQPAKASKSGPQRHAPHAMADMRRRLARPDLPALRAQIDAVDRELLALLNRRAALALAVGEIKKTEGSVVFRPEREAQVIDGLKALNPGPLGSDSVAPIWREIMSACRALETPTRVAYLGPAGTFSEQAALGYFGSSIVACPAPASTRCSAPPAPARPTSAWCRSRTRPKAWSRARSTCS